MYYNFFEDAVTNHESFIEDNLHLEFCFYLIPNLVALFLSKYYEYATFIIFAFIGVFLKIKAISKSDFFILSLLLYLGNLYLIQEMTTIRAGVVSGIFLLSIGDLKEKKNLSFFFKFLICLFFHYSSIIFLFPWLILRLKLSITSLLLTLLGSIVVAFLKINLLSVFMIGNIFSKVDTYMMMIGSEPDLNLFNFRIIFSLFIIFVFLINFERIKDNENFIILFKIHLISLIFFFALSSAFIVFSLRIYELLSVIQILLYPMIIIVFSKKLKIIGYIIIIFFSFIQYYYLIEISGFFKPYKSWIL